MPYSPGGRAVAEIWTIEQLRERRFRSGAKSRSPGTDREKYARALGRQQAERAAAPYNADMAEWRRAMDELDAVIGPPGGDAA